MINNLNKMCFRNIHLEESWSLKQYLNIGGYSIWKKILKGSIKREAIINEIKLSGLRGKGGAGFPTGLKWSFFPKHKLIQKYIVCNSDEGEPGTFKDKELLLKNPHQVIEGMAIAGFVLGATIGYNYIRGEFYKPGKMIEKATKEAMDNGLLGKNLFGGKTEFVLHNIYGAGAYICGEETALMNSIEGQKGNPRFKPPFPASFGIYGMPTNINNTETYATIPVLLENGARWHMNFGTPNSGGCKIFSISGHVKNPGNYEIPLGTSFKVLLKLAGGMRNNKKLKAVIPGGSSSSIIPENIMINTPMSFTGISSIGSMLGSGAVIVLNEDTCMIKLLLRVTKFYAEESCGQCTPCREGTFWLVKIMQKIFNKTSQLPDIDLLEKVAKNISGNTICAHGDAAAMPVIGMLKYYKKEFIQYIKNQ